MSGVATCIKLINLFTGQHPLLSEPRNGEAVRHHLAWRLCFNQKYFWAIQFGALAITISVNLSQSNSSFGSLISISCYRSMHKTPSQIARSLRALHKARKLGLLRSVRIVPGHNACAAAHSQRGIEYLGDTVPELPLAGCTSECCECDYQPTGSELLRRLNVNQKPLPEKKS
jgi:hypothetical protein